MRSPTRRLAAVPAAALLVGSLAVASSADSHDAGQRPGDTVDLDILFVGAHPDDEAFNLAAFGQWNEYHDLDVGVITVTRGEGGGNAVGLEEGPELGILREAEERRAVGYAGIENIYNLDKIDFYYTLSAPLTEQAWDGDDTDDTLSRVVRVIRETRPEVIVTMNPSPNTHGNHQQAARIAVEAYYAAADPDAFAEQIKDEDLEPWTVGRILRGGASGSGMTGPDCETTPYEPNDPTDRVFGTWQGRLSEIHGETWAMVARRGQWEYASQGWAVFPPPSSDPNQLGCNYYTLIDSRTPYPEPGSGPTAAVEGAALPTEGGLPLGTELSIDADQFGVLPGAPFGATVTAKAAGEPLVQPSLDVDVPDGWTVEQVDELPAAIAPGMQRSVDLVITPAADATVGDRVSLAASLTTPDGATGTNETAVEVASEVRGLLTPRPEIAIFNEWTHEQNLPKLQSLIQATASVGVGRTQEITVDVTNDGDAPASGTVSLDLADGFEANPADQPFDNLAAGESTSISFEVTNVDTALPTSSNAPDRGYPFQVITTSDSTTHVQDAVLELVPTTTVPQLTTAPVLDGVADAGEYPGEVLDASTHWEGTQVGVDDASATARVSFTDEALYVFVDVTDDALGTVLPPEDCKRHWRTDSVELTIDPRGTSQNSSTTFKTGIFPVTDDPANGDPPCFERDADNHQGPGAETAPGMEVASVVRAPYDGYTIEAKIPYDVLPDTVDPERMGFNVLVYDSDTQDKTGQTRIGWSTFPGVQANPYGWGLVTLPGLADSPPDPVAPVFPSEAALSVNSPQSIAQSAEDGVALGGGPGLEPRALQVQGTSIDGDDAVVRLRTNAEGQANVFIWDGESVVGSTSTTVPGGPTTVTVPLGDGGDDLTVLVAFSTDDGTAAAAAPIG